MKTQILKKGSLKGFKLLVGINRAIIPGQVTKIASSIENMGTIRPVIVAEINFLPERGTYILDGQHLFHSLIRLDMDIPYIKIKVRDKQDMVEKIALLNSSSKSWNLRDYILAWSSIVPDYAKLQNYFNIYDFELCLLASILMGSNRPNPGGGVTVKKIKRGEFKITNEAKKVVILDNLTDVLRVLPRMDRYNNLYTCTEYISFLGEMGEAYNHERFIASLGKRKSQFVLATQEEGRLVEMFKKLI